MNRTKILKKAIEGNTVKLRILKGTVEIDARPFLITALGPGLYEISVPENFSQDGKEYVFDHWSEKKKTIIAIYKEKT